MVAATHAHTSSSGTCSRLLRSDIFSLRLRVPFTFYDRSSGPFLSARFYRPVHTGRGKRVKTIVVERGGGGEDAKNTAAIRRESLDVVLWMSRSFPREDAFVHRRGWRNWRVGREILLSKRDRTKPFPTIREKNFEEALKIEGHSACRKRALLRNRAGHWRKFARHRGQATPGKDSRGARELESIRNSGELRCCTRRNAAEARIEVESIRGRDICAA